MSGADAAWLRMDRPHNLMIVTTVLRFARPPDWDQVENAVLTRVVGRFPRFRQRAVEPVVTVGLLSPSWGDDSTFHLDSHISRTTLAAAGDGQDALDAHIAQRASAELDRDRPLWHVEMVEVAGGPAALLLRTHHALADGTGLMRVIDALTDPLGEPRSRRTARAGRPRTPVDAASIERQAKVISKLGARIVRRGSSGPPLTASLVGTKQVALLPPVSIQRLKDAGRATSSTVNDVFLGAVAGALRAHLVDLDHPVTDLDVIIPVDVRDDSAGGDELGNHFGLAFLNLPVATVNRTERQAVVTARMRSIKASSEPHVIHAALSAMGSVPRAAERAWVDSFINDAVAVVTNIAGPPDAVALAGTPVTDMALLVPSTGPIGLGISLLSYDGRAAVSLIADQATLPELGPFSAALRDDLDRLVTDRG
jgi:hypothetical protein